MILKQLKKGDFFTRRPIQNPNEHQVFIRGDYDRSSKKYECTHFYDCSSVILLSGSTEVYTDFIF